MSAKTHHLYYLYYPGNWIIILLLLLQSPLTAQESTPEEFPIGSTMGSETMYNWEYYNSFDTSGMNTLYQYANGTTLPRLDQYYVVACNGDFGDWIQYYASSYYSKWEAEQNQTELDRVGVKHIGGSKVYYDSSWCWSTEGLSAPACSLVYGPHYRQDNRYKSWNHSGCRWCVEYVTRFRMALFNPDSVPDYENVCVIKVVYRYKEIYSDSTYEFFDRVFLVDTLRVEDFNADGSFNYFDFDGERYEYPAEFILPLDAGKKQPLPADTIRTDSESYTGIQFWVDWLRDDDSCTLYIDNIEVYDYDGWRFFIDDPNKAADSIKAYAERYHTVDWSKLLYWGGHDEPSSLDTYTPIKTVDAILKTVNAPRLMSTVWALWTLKLNDGINITEYLTRKISTNHYIRLLNYEETINRISDSHLLK